MVMIKQVKTTRNVCFVLLTLALLTACQTKPTRVSETQVRQFDLIQGKARRPLVLTEGTVVLDTRSAFEYGLNHVNGSLHLLWESLSEDKITGEMLRDLRKTALRLSLMGITPKTSIVVVGNGTRGRGEEGRLAWQLLYLGFVDVQVASWDVFRQVWTQKPTPQPANAETWTPQVRDELLADRDEFLKWARDPKLRNEQGVFIVDVRSSAEYFNRKGKLNAPDIQALNIEWKEFFDESGRPSVKLRDRLEGLGFNGRSRIYVISDHGVRSSAVAYALVALGFHKTQNFIGGWRSLLEF